MTIRVEHIVHAKISTDTDAKDLLYNRDKPTATEVLLTQQRQLNGAFSLAASGTETLALGDVNNVKGIQFEADGDVQSLLNGNTDWWVHERGDAVVGRKLHFHFEGNITSFQLHNPGATAVTGTWVVWGDPTA